MTTSAPRTASALATQAIALAAGAWTQLGVSGWTATHADWAIDPEPLILFTAWLGDRDPRLRDEATDWCIQNSRYLSRGRLKNLIRVQPDDVQTRFGELAATVAAHTGVMWPGATTARPFEPSGRSRLSPLSRPSMAWIRLRAIFGVGAKAEVLRYLLSDNQGSVSLSRLSTVTAYSKRNLADECQALAEAGVLASRQQGNRFDYSLANRTELEAFVGTLPRHRPDWSAVFNVTREFVELDERADSASRTFPVQVKSSASGRHSEMSPASACGPRSAPWPTSP